MLEKFDDDKDKIEFLLSIGFDNTFNHMLEVSQENKINILSESLIESIEEMAQNRAKSSLEDLLIFKNKLSNFFKDQINRLDTAEKLILNVINNRGKK